MPRHRRALAAVLLLAAMLFTSSAASAAPPSTGELPTASPMLLTRFWSLLIAHWSAAGCIVDPKGRGCAGAHSTVSALPDFLGCGIDPSGGQCQDRQTAPPAPPAFPDAGCGLDPSGTCGSNH